MTSKLETLREIIRELIRKELEEANTTASVGGQYSTPHAFRADEKDSEDELKLSVGMSVAKKLSESTYWDYRNDESMTTKQKLAKSMMNIRDGISLLERAVKYNVKLKNEMKFESDNYMKRTKTALNKISEKLLRLSTRVKDLI
jgi:hypothetical protein